MRSITVLGLALLLSACGGEDEAPTITTDLLEVPCPDVVPWEGDVPVRGTVITAEVLACPVNRTCSPSPLPSGTTVSPAGRMLIRDPWCPPGLSFRLFLTYAVR